MRVCGPTVNLVGHHISGFISLNVKTVLKLLTSVAVAGLIVGCASSPPPPPEHSAFSTEPNAATLLPYRQPDRRETYTLWSLGPCNSDAQRKLSRQNHSTPIFRGPNDETRVPRVRTDRPVVVGYQLNSGDTTCAVTAMAFLEPGKRYTIEGTRVFQGSVLPSLSGCELRVIEAESRTPVPVMPGGLALSDASCTAPAGASSSNPARQ